MSHQDNLTTTGWVVLAVTNSSTAQFCTRAGVLPPKLLFTHFVVALSRKGRQTATRQHNNTTCRQWVPNHCTVFLLGEHSLAVATVALFVYQVMPAVDMVYCAFSYLLFGHDVQMHQLGIEVQIGVDRGVLVDRQIAVLQGDVRALHNDLKSNHKTMLSTGERHDKSSRGRAIHAAEFRLSAVHTSKILGSHSGCYAVSQGCGLRRSETCFLLRVLELDALLSETSGTTNLNDMAERPGRLKSSRIILGPRTALCGQVLINNRPHSTTRTAATNPFTISHSQRAAVPVTMPTCTYQQCLVSDPTRRQTRHLKIQRQCQHGLIVPLYSSVNITAGGDCQRTLIKRSSLIKHVLVEHFETRLKQAIMTQ